MQYVKEYQAKGKKYYYFRAGKVNQKLPDNPSTPEFQARYRELLETVKVLRAPAAPGSIEALIADYKRSPEFAKLSPAAQTSYAKALDFLRPIAKARTADLKRAHVLKLRDSLRSTPRTADLFVSITRRLLNWAVDRGHLDLNPVLMVRPINEPVSRIPWTDADCDAFEASAPREALMTAYMIGRYTGQRRGDVLSMTRAQYDGSGLTITQSKTGEKLWIPAHGLLRNYLDELSRVGLLCVTAKGGQWDGPTFSRHCVAKAP